MKTFAKVEYDDPKDEKYYYDVNITPVPVKELPPLDHDSIMNPTLAPVPTTISTSTPTPTPTSQSFSEDFTDNVNIMGLSFNGNKYIIVGSMVAFFMILITLIYLLTC